MHDIRLDIRLGKADHDRLTQSGEIVARDQSDVLASRSWSKSSYHSRIAPSLGLK